MSYPKAQWEKFLGVPSEKIERWLLEFVQYFWRVHRSTRPRWADVFDFIEVFCNPKRRHSTLGYVSPVKFEEALFA